MKEFSLGKILEGLKEKFSPGTSPKEKIRAVLSQTLGEDIPIGSLSVRGKVLFVNISPVLKHELYLKKQACLQCLLEQHFFFDDIR